MKKIAFTFLLAALCGITGCFPTSLNPLYADKDVVFEPTLVGVWQGEDSNEAWNFEKSGDNSYKLVYTDKEGKTASFETHLLKLGTTLFLDFFPDESSIQQTNRSEIYQYHLVRTHSFARVSLTEPALQISFLSLEWLGKLLEKDPKAIQHHLYGTNKDDFFVLTAPTKELQNFVLKHMATKEAFLEPINLKRKQAQSK